ncbi:hypothetical protein HELRODRAFT_175392 [Helobdella robusta]|uniref:EF-hand domain-containing protein n=1 Tax=Helobdella robusta TaxID=6412 RepID=T1F984_HELRO|nr:hypothetical protein HELRODRAFT_175392 [Helobdella robusta]ESO00896.1 hypothetical protein HELRODRAFT_175392 [Helobdella robusta]
MNKESLKDIMGFYFAIDGSITIYEYKQFGRESKILPLIKRNTYTHMRGPRKGENYVITDVIQVVNYANEKQPLPDVWKNQDKLIVNIMSVDIEAKRSILLKNIDKYQHENVWNKLHMPKTDAEERYIRIPYQVKVCQSEKSTEKVNVYELEAGLAKFEITLSDNKLSGILEILDPDSTSFVSYLSFMRYVLGEMESERKCLVLKAFLKIDSTRNGIISTSLIHKFLNALKHAKVKTKEKSDEEIKKTFENAFKDSSNLATQPKTTVTYREFEELFEGLSLKIASNVEFSNILKNMWSV